MKKKYQDRIRNRPEGQASITGHDAYLRLMLAVPPRVDRVRRDLRLVDSIFASLFSDENFVTLLRAEAITLPTYLKPLLEKGTARSDEIA